MTRIQHHLTTAHSLTISRSQAFTRTNSQIDTLHHKSKQVAQLSQGDCTAGQVSYGRKWKTGTGRQYFTDIRGQSSTTVMSLASKAIKFSEKMQNKGNYAVQGHSRSWRSVSIKSPRATSY